MGLWVARTLAWAHGAVVAEPALVSGDGGRVMGAVDAARWALTYARTDRICPPVPFVAA